MLGFKNPWLRLDHDKRPIHKKFFVAASGDDVVIWSPRGTGSYLAYIIRKLTGKAKSKRQRCIGLGQVVKTITVGKWHEIDF